jgi:uncharacterized protein YhbP (UPF0306 family)
MESLQPNGAELRRLAADLIESQSTMTLATAKAREAWAAPVYFVYSDTSFYFFSDPASRHIQESQASGQASSAISAKASSWVEIRGIQMSGRIELVPAGFEAIEAVKAYSKKFPFVKDFFSSGQLLDPAAFAKRFRVKLYRFKPDLIYYLDNGIRFGFREEITL